MLICESPTPRPGFSALGGVTSALTVGFRAMLRTIPESGAGADGALKPEGSAPLNRANMISTKWIVPSSGAQMLDRHGGRNLASQQIDRDSRVRQSDRLDHGGREAHERASDDQRAIASSE